MILQSVFSPLPLKYKIICKSIWITSKQWVARVLEKIKRRMLEYRAESVEKNCVGDLTWYGKHPTSFGSGNPVFPPRIVRDNCKEFKLLKKKGTSLAVHWLGLHASNTGGMGLVLSQGTMIPHALWHSQKIKRKRKEGKVKVERKQLRCCNPKHIHPWVTSSSITGHLTTPP